MKGDIRLSKKAALLIAGAISLFTMADFVSLIDTKSSGGIVVEGVSDEELNNAIEEGILNSMPIGSVTFRMDSVNPSSIYGGSWTLITGDASLSFGDGTAQGGLASGNNTPNVPLLQHTHIANQAAHNHSMNHNHPAATTDQNSHAHNHTIPVHNNSSSGSTYGILAGQHRGAWVDSFPIGNQNTNHTHVFDVPNFSGNTGSKTPAITVQNQGVANAKLDVRGAQIKINVWKRTG